MDEEIPIARVYTPLIELYNSPSVPIWEDGN
jgi:hypothetical protein